MGTTLVGAVVVGGDLVFAHCGDSRAYLVRDAIAMQLTEDHTLMARLMAAGVEVDTTGEGSRFKSMLTNALGIGQECRVSTFVVPLADGDRFMLCSDGISEYVKEAEVGEVLTSSASPARAAQKLIELALERGGGDNATAIVVRVLEAGESPRPAEHQRKRDTAIEACKLWAKLTPQQRLRALRIAIERDHVVGDRLPAHTLGDRVAWVVIEGEVDYRRRHSARTGDIALVSRGAARRRAAPRDRAALATVPRTDVRALAIRADDFREICEEDSELGEALLEGLAAIMSARVGERGGDELLGRAATAGDLGASAKAAVGSAPTMPPPVGVKAAGAIAVPSVTASARAASCRAPRVASVPAPVETTSDSIPTVVPDGGDGADRCVGYRRDSHRAGHGAADDDWDEGSRGSGGSRSDGDQAGGCGEARGCGSRWEGATQ